jgi:hypothetical protein
MVGSIRGISRVSGATTTALRGAHAVGAGGGVSAVRAQETARAQMAGIGSSVSAQRAQLGVSFEAVLHGVSSSSGAFSAAAHAQRLAMEERDRDNHALVMERRGAELERHALDLQDRVHTALELGTATPVVKSQLLLEAPPQPVALLTAG